MIDGIVTKTGYDATYGNYVHIKISPNTILTYSHLNKVLVKENANVKSGDIIALGGSTGNSTGNHLHLSLFYNDTAYDPINLVKYDYTESFLLESQNRGNFNYETSN